MTKHHSTLRVFAAVLLTACGGGGDSDSGQAAAGSNSGASPSDPGLSTTAPVTPATAGTVQSLCNPLDYAYQAGNTLVMTTANHGLVEGPGTTTAINRGMASFEGRNAFETEVTIDAPPTNTTSRILSVVKTYSERTGSTETTTYGEDAVYDSDTAQGHSTLRAHVVQSPALVDKRFGLKAGESVTLNWREKHTSSGNIGSLAIGPLTQDVSFDQQVTFVGVETLTVPAGTFQTCHFEGKIESTVSEWWLVGYPLQIKLIERDAAGVVKQTIEAQSITVNGTRL